MIKFWWCKEMVKVNIDVCIKRDMIEGDIRWCVVWCGKKLVVIVVVMIYFISIRRQNYIICIIA